MGKSIFNSSKIGKSLDLGSTSQPNKRQPSCEKCLTEDRLSSLPDDILLFILSSLPVKDAVKTGLLSRRWLNLWIYTSVLHFHAPVKKTIRGNKLFLVGLADRECLHFVKGVKRVLWRHKGRHLKEFKIVCDLNKRNQKDIDNWLIFALAKKVQCLELNLLDFDSDPSGLHENYVFPSRFLNFRSEKTNSDDGMNQDLQFDLKCLKSLSLKSVDITGEAINFFLLNCPFLERLEVVGSLQLVSLVILDPTLVLKYLKIKFCHKLEVLNVSNFNLVSLDISSVEDLTLTCLPMLVELFISGASVSLTHSVSQASSYFSQLEAFTLDGYKVEVEDVTQLINCNELTKLKRLVIEFNVRGKESLIPFISIINYCPCLEEFVLTMNWFFDWKQSFRGKIIHEVERHNSSLRNTSLKVFEFVGYYGRVSDVELIMHLLANAVGLKKMVIDPRCPLLIDCVEYVNKADNEARNHALQQFKTVKGSIPPRVHIFIR